MKTPNNIIVCCVAVLAFSGFVNVDAASDNEENYITKFKMDAKNDDVIAGPALSSVLSSNKGEQLGPPLSMESMCILANFNKSYCWSEILKDCIRKIPLEPLYDKKVHLDLLETERMLCLSKGPQYLCVHQELYSCAHHFDFFDASEDFAVCKEVVKAKKCMEGIQNKCFPSTDLNIKEGKGKNNGSSPGYWTEGMYKLVVDRISIVERECASGYYAKKCERDALIGCFDKYLAHGMDCNSPYQESAMRCLHTRALQCRTSPAQVVVRQMTDALTMRCIGLA